VPENWTKSQLSIYSTQKSLRIIYCQKLDSLTVTVWVYVQTIWHSLAL